jgi:hypothetical protein
LARHRRAGGRDVLSGSAERRGNHLRVPAQKRGAGLVAGARADAGVRASADEADEPVPSQRTRGARALLVRLKEGERPTGRMTGGPSWSVRGKGGERLVGFAGTVMIGGPRVGVRMGQFGQGLGWSHSSYPKNYPLKGIFCPVSKILQYSTNFSASVIPYILYSIPTNIRGAHLFFIFYPSSRGSPPSLSFPLSPSAPPTSPLHGVAPDAAEGGSGSTPFVHAPGDNDLARRRGRGPRQPAEERHPDPAGPASPPSLRIRGSRGGGGLRTGGYSAMEKRGGARSGPAAAPPWVSPSPP